MALPDHRHCKVCGKVCAPNADTCSKACQEKRDANLRSKRLWTGIMYLLIVFFVALLILEFLH